MARLSSQHPACSQRLYFFLGDSPRAEDGGGVGPTILRWVGSSGRGSGEARRRRRLYHAADLDKGAAGDVVRMARSFFHGQYRREASIGSFEQRAPFIPRSRLKELFKRMAKFGAIFGVCQAEAVEQDLAEFQLDRRDGDKPPVAAFVSFVNRGSTIEQIRAALQTVQPRCMQTLEKGHQRRRAFGHRRVYDLSLAGALRLKYGAGHAEREIERAAAEIRDRKSTR